MPLFAESEEKIYGDILVDVVNSTNISRTSPGSKMRALIEAVSQKLGRMYSTFDLNIGQAFLDGAEGQFLNYIGDMMNLPRQGETGASVGVQDRIVRMFVDIGNFGDINSGNPITIPTGTLISTAPGGAGIAYRTVISTVLAADVDEAYLAVESVRTGTANNVGANQLVHHTFTGYDDSVNNSLQVTNDSDVSQASDVESDSNYRFRIANQLLNLETSNPTSIRLTALAVPGVADVEIVPFHRGIGTYDLLIKSTAPNISQSLIDAVSEALIDVTAQGIVPEARGPKEIGISVVASLTYRRVLSESEQSSIIQAATDNVTAYINNLDIGEDFIAQEVLERILDASDLIQKVGTLTQPFDNLYIYKPSRLEDGKTRSTLVEDYEADVDERVIVENRLAGSTPILIRSA